MLEMGEPVQIMDLARDMIRFSGLEPDTRHRDRDRRPAPGREAARGAVQPLRAARADARAEDPARRAPGGRSRAGCEETFDEISLLVLEGDAAGLAAKVAELAGAGRRGRSPLRSRSGNGASPPSRGDGRRPVGLLDSTASAPWSDPRVLAPGPGREVRRLRRDRRLLRPGRAVPALLRPGARGQAPARMGGPRARARAGAPGARGGPGRGGAARARARRRAVGHRRAGQPVAPAAGNGRQAGTPAPIPMGPRPGRRHGRRSGPRRTAAPAHRRGTRSRRPRPTASRRPATRGRRGGRRAGGQDGAPPSGDDAPPPATSRRRRRPATSRPRDAGRRCRADGPRMPEEPSGELAPRRPARTAAAEAAGARAGRVSEPEPSPPAPATASPAQPPTADDLPRRRRSRAPRRARSPSRNPPGRPPPRRCGVDHALGHPAAAAPQPAAAARRGLAHRALHADRHRRARRSRSSCPSTSWCSRATTTDAAAEPDRGARRHPDVGGRRGRAGGRRAAGRRSSSSSTARRSTGLASRERDKLIAAGYADGMIRIDNSDDQPRQDSLVLYAADERRAGARRRRGCSTSRASRQIDEETQALADSSDETGTLPADVVVMLGADKAP